MTGGKLHRNKDVDKLLRTARRQGFDPKPTKSGHVQVRLRGKVICTFPGTASCSRAYANGLADLRRAGLVYPRSA